MKKPRYNMDKVNITFKLVLNFLYTIVQAVVISCPVSVLAVAEWEGKGS